MRFKLIEGQLARLLEELAQYDLQILHRSGSKHSNAEGLSRIPDTVKPCDCYNAGLCLSDLPCSGCKYCTRAHEQWSRFLEEVDDVLPLAVGHVTEHPQEPDKLAVRPVKLYPDSSSEDEEQGHLQPVFGHRDDQSSHIHEDLSSSDEEDQCHTSSTTRHQDGHSSHSMSVPGRQNDHSFDLNSWMDKYTDEDIKDMQRADADIRPVLTWLETAEPSQADLFLSSTSTKYFWLQQDCLILKDGLLYHRADSEAPLCLVIPSCLRDEALRLVHDSPSAGHMGIKKTLAIITEIVLLVPHGQRLYLLR